MTKLSATAPSWSPVTRLSATAPSWKPGGASKESSLPPPVPSPAPSPSPSPSTVVNGNGTPKDAAVAKKFSFSGTAKPFTPPGEKTPVPPQVANPVAAFPSTPVVTTAGPGRPSKLVASAAPFTPKSVATPSPKTLDPTAKEFRPEDVRTSPQHDPQMWRRAHSYEDIDGMACGGSPQIHHGGFGKPGLTGFERRAMSHDSLDSYAPKSKAVTIQAPVQPKLPKLPKTVLTDEQLASKHPLCTSWTLWFKSASAPSSADWSDTLKTIFTLSDVETFWGVYNQIKAPSTLQKGSTYYLFREGIKPMWEDKTCAQGGEWRVWVPAAKKNDLDTVWVMTSLLCIGEQLPMAEQVCGVAVETRNKSDRISLWVKSTEQAKAMAVGREFKSRLVGFVPAEQPATFTSHSKALGGADKSVEYCIAD
eukprot:TRINITY_DN5231_c1_g2_i1.p1 TRINITY_DN5231_c1_g2~~TRINITY_DN5231_c1_g2_i1.p1  ORF type:complete len:420 (+),score=50.30 TRINITY_DN5231_c1_g2_i1:24-1283(+)